MFEMKYLFLNAPLNYYYRLPLQNSHNCSQFAVNYLSSAIQEK